MPERLSRWLNGRPRWGARPRPAREAGHVVCQQPLATSFHKAASGMVFLQGGAQTNEPTPGAAVGARRPSTTALKEGSPPPRVQQVTEGQS